MSHPTSKHQTNGPAMDESALLSAFVVNHRDLEKLEALLAEFNIFEAVGMTRQEIRHSHFLAFLLNPAQNHGLGDAFLKRWLKNVLIAAEQPPVSPIDIDIADMQQADVRREWRHIDILVHDPENKLVCLIENKIDSGEHSNQLKRYHNIVQNEFPTCRLIPIFLSPGGDTPSHPVFISTSYDTIADILESVCATYRSIIGPDVATLITHYITMLRRHIVSDSEIAELCRKIYRQHQQALDLIFEHRPDLQFDIAGHLAKFVERDFAQHRLKPFLIENKRYFQFYPPEWDELPEALQNTPVDNDDHNDLPLLFEIQNEPDQLVLRLCITQDLYDPPYPESVCQRLLDTAQAQPKVFRRPDAKLRKRWTWLHQDQFLSARDYDGADMESLTEKIEAKWQKFLEQDLPKIRAQIGKIDWSGLKFG